MKVFAVRDAALGQFMSPFVAPAVGMAMRSFADEVNRQDCPMNAHPADYELFELGEYDPDTGRISPHSAPKTLSRAKDVFVPLETAPLRAVK